MTGDASQSKSLVVDVDGTLCPIKTEGECYSELPVNSRVLARLKEYRKNGFRIVLHTARNMRTYESNLGVINKNTAPVLLEWLARNDIPYDEIHFGKPWPGAQGFYLDDRSIRPREFVRHSFSELQSRMLLDRQAEEARLQVVIPMAGRGSRFTSVGYTRPKYEIEAKGLSLFYWSMLSLTHMIRSGAKFYFVTLEENDAETFIADQCRMIGIDDYSIVEVPDVTDGQATSVMAVEPHWSSESPLLVYNIDTYVVPGNIDLVNTADVEGWIPCMKAEGEHWSFVECRPDGIVTRVTEKQRISDNCSIGLYWFSSCGLYADSYKDFYASWPRGKEKYIAPMYSSLIEGGLPVMCSSVPRDSVHALGTPEELDEFKFKV